LGFGNLYASTGDHIGHFYQSSAEGKDVLISFLKTGLDAHEKCVCLAGSNPRPQELLEALGATGMDVERALASGQLVVEEGKSDPSELREMLSLALGEIPRRFPLLRWAEITSWAFKKLPTTAKLREWETYCDTIENPAAVFLCQYELSGCPGTVVMDAMQTHPICIVNSVIHQNPYYEKPQACLKTVHSRTTGTVAS